MSYSVEEALRIADGAVVSNPHADAMRVLAREVRRLRPYETESRRLRDMLAAHRSLEVLESR